MENAKEEVREDPVQRTMRRWIRFFYVLCNSILAILGAGGLTIAVMSKMDTFKSLMLLDHYENLNVTIFLTCSAVLIVIGSLGVFAGLMKNYMLSLANGLLLAVFLVGTITYTTIIGATTDYTGKSSNLHKQMEQDMNNYNKDIVDQLHIKLSCCGLHDITTWDENAIPESCCGTFNETGCTLGSPYLHTNGCFEEFNHMLRHCSWLFFSTLTLAGLMEIFGIILSSLQCHIIKDSRRKKNTVQTDDLKIPRPQKKSSVFVENESKDDEIQKTEEKEKEKPQGKVEKDGMKTENKENSAMTSEKSESPDRKDNVEVDKDKDISFVNSYDIFTTVSLVQTE